MCLLSTPEGEKKTCTAQITDRVQNTHGLHQGGGADFAFQPFELRNL